MGGAAEIGWRDVAGCVGLIKARRDVLSRQSAAAAIVHPPGVTRPPVAGCPFRRPRLDLPAAYLRQQPLHEAVIRRELERLFQAGFRRGCVIACQLCLTERGMAVRGFWKKLQL